MIESRFEWDEEDIVLCRTCRERMILLAGVHLCPNCVEIGKSERKLRNWVVGALIFWGILLLIGFSLL